MRSETCRVADWVAQSSPATVYGILAGASDAAPLQHYYRLDGRRTPQGLYLGTAYAQWHEVMPYLVALDADSPFIEWVAETTATDWGWLLASEQPVQTLYQHLQGLTQVWHQGQPVFFRYWDGAYLLPMVTQLGDRFTHLLPELAGLWQGGQGVRWEASEARAPREFPWWELPDALAAQLAVQDRGTLINNLMQQLAERNGQLYWAFPEANLRYKVARFIERHPSPDTDLFPALEAALINEVQA